MITGILLLSVIAFIGVISYKRPGLTHRAFKNIPLIDWLIIFVLPIMAYYAFSLIVKNIIIRPKVEILDFTDSSFFILGVLFLVYAFVGNSIHFVGKVLSRYIKEDKHSLVYQINEVFHGKLSHYLVYVCTILLIFMTALLELNHPSTYRLNKIVLQALTLSGLLVGFSSAKAIFYTHEWYGGNKKPYTFLISLLLSILLILFKINNLNYSFYPMNLFTATFFAGFLGVFIFRQILIFSHLSRKRRLQFLARLLSV